MNFSIHNTKEVVKHLRFSALIFKELSIKTITPPFGYLWGGVFMSLNSLVHASYQNCPVIR